MFTRWVHEVIRLCYEICSGSPGFLNIGTAPTDQHPDQVGKGLLVFLCHLQFSRHVNINSLKIIIISVDFIIGLCIVKIPRTTTQGENQKKKNSYEDGDDYRRAIVEQDIVNGLLNKQLQSQSCRREHISSIVTVPSSYVFKWRIMPGDKKKQSRQYR